MPPDTTPTGQTTPRRTPQAWRDALLQVRLPLLGSAAQQARMLSPDIGLGELQALAEADLPLAVDLLAMAAREPRLQDGVRSLQQAVHVLGTGRTQGLLRARQARPASESATAQQLSRQAMASSALAALFVQAWGRHRPAGDEDHRRWLTRLMGVVRWKLPWVDPELAQRIEARVEAGERRALVERELLGVDVPTLNAWHLQDLGFGATATQDHAALLSTRQLAQAARLAWTGAAAPEVPAALARVLHQPRTGCALACALALELQSGWYGARAGRWMAVVSAHLGQPLERVRQDLIAVALIAARDEPLHQGPSAVATRLLWPAEPHHRPLPRRPARAPAAPPAPAPPPAGADFEQRCERAAFDDLASFMREALTHLQQDMGLTRCALFLQQAGRSELACHVAHGFATPVATRDLVLPLAADGLVTRLMQHPAATLWIKPRQVPAARARLPAPLSEWMTASGCLLGTVQVRSRAVGLWWADVAEGQAPIDDHRLAQFGRMTRVFGAEFARLLNLQRARRQTTTATS